MNGMMKISAETTPKKVDYPGIIVRLLLPCSGQRTNYSGCISLNIWVFMDILVDFVAFEITQVVEKKWWATRDSNL